MENFDTNYEPSDIADTTTCPDCKDTAEIVVHQDGYIAYCPFCGRILKETRETVEDAIAAFKQRDEVEYV